MNDHTKIDNRLLEERAHRIAALLSGYIYKGLTHAEHDELKTWAGENDGNERLFKELTDEKISRFALDWLLDADGPRMLNKINGTLRFIPPVLPPPLNHYRYPVIAISVGITLVLLILLYFLFLRN